MKPAYLSGARLINDDEQKRFKKTMISCESELASCRHFSEKVKIANATELALVSPEDLRLVHGI